MKVAEGKATKSKPVKYSKTLRGQELRSTRNHCRQKQGIRMKTEELLGSINKKLDTFRSPLSTNKQ